MRKEESLKKNISLLIFALCVIYLYMHITYLLGIDRYI